MPAPTRGARLAPIVIAAVVGVVLAGCAIRLPALPIPSIPIHPPVSAPNVRPAGKPADIGQGLSNFGQATIPADGLIVVEGDGLAYGTDPRGRLGGINGSPLKRTALPFPEGLAKALRVTVENRGFPGDTLARGEARWAGQPTGSVLILAYGYGDAQAKTPAAAYTATLDRMVAAAQAKGSSVFLVVPPLVGNAAFDGLVEPYRVAARQEASRFRVGILDTPVLIAANIRPQPAIFEARGANGGHEFSEEYKLIANSLATYILIAPPAS